MKRKGTLNSTNTNAMDLVVHTTRTSEFKHQSAIAYPSKDVESTSAGANT